MKLKIFNDGYVALGIVSTVSLLMLLIVIDIGQQSNRVRSQVSLYEDWLTSESLILSCVSIARQKIINGDGLAEIKGVDKIWKLRSGDCEIKFLNETSFTLELQITVPPSTITLKIEKENGRVLRLQR